MRFRMTSYATVALLIGSATTANGNGYGSVSPVLPEHVAIAQKIFADPKSDRDSRIRSLKAFWSKPCYDEDVLKQTLILVKRITSDRKEDVVVRLAAALAWNFRATYAGDEGPGSKESLKQMQDLLVKSIKKDKTVKSQQVLYYLVEYLVDDVSTPPVKK